MIRIRERTRNGLIFMQKIKFFFKEKESGGHEEKIWNRQIMLKAIITGILAFLSSLLGILAIPCGLMVSSNLVDYGTGLITSKFRKPGYKFL